MKFMKKPIVIEAEQWDGRAIRGVCLCASDECGRAPHVQKHCKSAMLFSWVMTARHTE